MTQALEVRFVDLPAMTVASALGFGKEPEHKAAQMMGDFAAKHGIEPGPKNTRRSGSTTRTRPRGARTTATSCGCASNPEPNQWIQS